MNQVIDFNINIVVPVSVIPRKCSQARQTFVKVNAEFSLKSPMYTPMTESWTDYLSGHTTEIYHHHRSFYKIHTACFLPCGFGEPDDYKDWDRYDLKDVTTSNRITNGKGHRDLALISDDDGIR